MKPKKIRILLTGGGTGGHIYPLVAVSEELKKIIIEHGSNPDIRYFGNPGMLKDYLVSYGIKVVNISSSKFRRYSSILNVLDGFRFILGLFQGLWKIYWFMPDLIFSKGGPGALAVVKAARFYEVPLIVHESDAIPGLTNRISSKSSRLVELALKSAEPYFKARAQIKISGNPVRQVIELAERDPMLKAEFGFNPAYPMILVMGGSQGAERMNDFIIQYLERLLEKFQILHQVGTKNFMEYQKECSFMMEKFDEKLKKRYVPLPYLDQNIAKAYGAADVIIGRAGAGLIFEAAAVGIPAILVPLPESANDHQVANAYEYERAGAAVVIEEENLLPNVVIGELERLLGDKKELERMSVAAKHFYRPNAARAIAEDIFNLIFQK